MLQAKGVWGHTVVLGAGGRVRVHLRVKGLGVVGQLPDLRLTVGGDNLHAPLVERIVELPMDITEGDIHGPVGLYLLSVRCVDV